MWWLIYVKKFPTRCYLFGVTADLPLNSLLPRPQSSSSLVVCGSLGVEGLMRTRPTLALPRFSRPNRPADRFFFCLFSLNVLLNVLSFSQYFVLYFHFLYCMGLIDMLSANHSAEIFTPVTMFPYVSECESWTDGIVHVHQLTPSTNTIHLHHPLLIQ